MAQKGLNMDTLNFPVTLIGTYKGKIDLSLQDMTRIDYHLDRVMAKADFDNGKINGYNGFFTYQKDCVDFVFNGKFITLDEISNNLTEDQMKLLDSLDEGDVIVIDAEVCVECRFGYHEIFSCSSEINNIRKYNDKEAASKIRTMISKMPKQ